MAQALCFDCQCLWNHRCSFTIVLWCTFKCFLRWRKRWRIEEENCDDVDDDDDDDVHDDDDYGFDDDHDDDDDDDDDDGGLPEVFPALVQYPRMHGQKYMETPRSSSSWQGRTWASSKSI